MTSNEFGFASECYALAYLLKAKQFEFIASQLSLGGVAVDLLMRDRSTFLIIEVKSAARGFFFAHRVGSRQARRLKRASQSLRQKTGATVILYEIRVRWGEVPHMWPIL